MISNQSIFENLYDSKTNLSSKVVNSQPHKDTTLTKIFVGGLPYHTTDESLRLFFESFGPIEEAVVITDRQNGKSRGYGFVTMTNCDDAYRAISNPNPCIDGRKANVNLAILGAKPRVLPGVNLNSMALSRLVPIQSLVPSIYNNMMLSPLMSTNLLGLHQPNLSSSINITAMRNSTPYANSIFNLPTSPTLAGSLRNNYQFMPYSVNGDTSLQVPQSNTVTDDSNSQIYATDAQYMSTLNFQQQLNNITHIPPAFGMLNNTDISAAQINQSVPNYQIDSPFFV